MSGSLVDGSNPATVSAGPCLINCSNYIGRGFYSFHTGGINVVMADGSVRFLSETTSTKMIAFAMTYSGGEIQTDF
jgi:prepilin-type processing-associated H-X9-DG protein